MRHIWELRRRTVMMAPDAGGANGAQAAENDAGGVQADENDASREERASAAEKTFTQADIDRIVRREQAKWKRQQEMVVNQARTEAERLASMTAEERAREQANRREAELTRREAEITRRELRAQALEMLARECMPVQLAELLDYGDAERCSASLDTVKKTWQSAVQQGVEARVAGPAPKDAGGKREKPQSLRDAISGYYNV